MTLSYRSRTEPTLLEWGSEVVEEQPPGPYDPVPTAKPGSIENTSSQVTGSESHTRSRSGKYESGGPFFTTRHSRSLGLSHFSGKREGFFTNGKPTGWTAYYHGAPVQFPNAFSEQFISKESIPSRSTDLSDLDPFGAEAISKCSPANPASEVGTGVSELYREGLPLLPGVQTWQRRTNLAKAAGSEYLNAVFGWEPLVSEVKDFASVVRRHRDILNQYSRNAGTNVRRRFNFPVEKEQHDEVLASEVRALVGGYVPGRQYFPHVPNQIIRTRGVERQRWFSGAFTYMLPSQTDTWQKALGYGSDADVLFGASLNPELLYNLTPWSWAVDWFTNAGDVINNISNVLRAGQVMRYGYMMEETKSFIRYTMTSSGYQGIPSPQPLELSRVTKVRSEANPFGFGLTGADLSTTQELIIAALGITLL